MIPLTQNFYSINDSFEAGDRLRSIPTVLFNEVYRYFPFDIISLFTNVPSNKTINITLYRIYIKKSSQNKHDEKYLEKID